MFEDWSQKSDDEIFKNASEQPRSQAAYWRSTEIQRRLYLLQQQLLQAQLDATAVQRDASETQREATAVMKRQATIMLWSVIGIFATAIMTLAAAFVR